MNSAASESVEQARSRAARPFYLQLCFLVLLAMAAGMALGALYPDAGVRMAPLGDAFIKAIRVLIAPIIFCTVVHGIAGMASMAKVGRVAFKALIYFEVLTTTTLSRTPLSARSARETFSKCSTSRCCAEWR